MSDYIFYENEANSNIININNDNEDHSDEEISRGIYSESHDDKNKSSFDNNQDKYGLLMENDIIPYSPEMSEEPINPIERKKTITDSIINNNNESHNVFTFKNFIKKSSNSNFNDNDESFERNDNEMKLDDLDTNNNNKDEQDPNQIKANIINLEEIINKRNNKSPSNY